MPGTLKTRVLVLGLLLFAVVSGCGLGQNKKRAPITEDEFIEITAQWAVLEARYDYAINEANQEGDAKKSNRLLANYEKALEDLFKKHRITTNDLVAFQYDNPGFAERYETTERILRRTETIFEELR